MLHQNESIHFTMSHVRMLLKIVMFRHTKRNHRARDNERIRAFLFHILYQMYILFICIYIYTSF